MSVVLAKSLRGISSRPRLSATLATLVLISGASAQSTMPPPLTGSATVRVTEEGASIDRFDQKKFPDFANQTLTRYFKLGNKVNVVARANAQRAIQDIELIGPSRCLATGINRTGWQKLRFEFNHRVDDIYLAQTSNVRFEFLVRLISGEVADFPHEYEPPADRFKQIAPADLTDLASKLAEFMRTQMNRECFNKPNLEYCPTANAEVCQ